MKPLLASIVVLSFNQLEKTTRPCIESIYRHTDPEKFELIVVDNASEDGAPQYLRGLMAEHDNIKICLNKTNRGYAGGNNDGMKLAEGKYIALLNNDTLATPGWLEQLTDILAKNPGTGLLSPITNYAGNEQCVELPGITEKNYCEVARVYTHRRRNSLFETEKVGFFCVAMPSWVPERIGFLDEAFGMGLFEDDDYCLRVKNDLGLSVCVTEGCFIFHKGSSSFKKLDPARYQALFDRNRKYFCEKHNIQWRFGDIAEAFLAKLEKDIESYETGGSEKSRHIESIRVRLTHFRNAIFQLKHFETDFISMNSQGAAEAEFQGDHWRLRGKLTRRLGKIRKSIDRKLAGIFRK
ncbi:Putative teichuronic acid biosynthesis glycosyltransferase TuaH (fragment) [Candidatus Desulfarcum epimagneticum]|uniref:Teichuronic acid biosynthesis glycosyltransferase TuaH n=1 Tax=uncultured Desulfobacteraceae bacterium TaxID=218296 RepID=A0A484HJG9_9BACT